MQICCYLGKEPKEDRWWPHHLYSSDTCVMEAQEGKSDKQMKEKKKLCVWSALMAICAVQLWKCFVCVCVCVFFCCAVMEGKSEAARVCVRACMRACYGKERCVCVLPEKSAAWRSAHAVETRLRCGAARRDMAPCCLAIASCVVASIISPDWEAKISQGEAHDSPCWLSPNLRDVWYSGEGADKLTFKLLHNALVWVDDKDEHEDTVSTWGKGRQVYL